MSVPDGSQETQAHPAAPLSRATLEHSITARFHEVVRAHGDRTALESAGEQSSYRDLDARAGSIAGAVSASSRGLGRVALLLPQGSDLIAAMFGVLEAGHAYVPLGVTMPPDSWRERVVHSGAHAVLTCHSMEAAARRALGDVCEVWRVDEVTTQAASDRVRPLVGPEALASIYYTSGTTGRPRGVMDIHRNVLHNVMRYSQTLGFDPGDRMTLIQSSTFSGAASSVFGALLNGATLLPYDMPREGTGPPLARWLARSRPTIFHSVPTLFRGLCEGDRHYPSVRLVRLEGDVATPRDVMLFRRHFNPEAVLVNGLGATETGICRQFFVRPGTGVPPGGLPVGQAVADMHVEVVDEDGDPVPPGVIGEIRVRSRYLASGYWKDPGRTAARFVTCSDPPGERIFHTGDAGRLDADGCLEHMGRRDDQFKMHGEWVDLSAIERACESAPGVSAAVIVPERDEEGELTLAAYLVAASDEAPQWAAVHEHLRAIVPAAMLPSRLWLVDTLPVTPEGKRDRTALRAIEARRLHREDAIVAPRTQTERSLADIWSAVLGIRHVGVHDRFGDLGGSSINAARVLAEIERRLNRAFSLADLMEAHTISDLARLIDGSQSEPLRGTLVRLQPYGDRTPLFCVHDLESDAFLFAPFARAIGPRQPVFSLRYPPGEPASRVPVTLSDLAARYLSDLREVRPEGPYRLAGFCFGGVVALEMAHQLAAAGERVERLALFNVTPFDLPDRVSAQALRRFERGWLARMAYVSRKHDRLSWVGRRLTRTGRDLVARWTDRAGLHAKRELTADAECVRARLIQAFRAHRTRPFCGDVLIALAEETLPLYCDDPAEAWRPLSEPAPEILRHPHDGYAMLMAPEVDTLAARLQDWFGGGLQDQGNP